MNEILINILSVIVTVVVIPLITWCGTELVKFIQTKTNNVKASENLTIATNIVTNAVKTVFQTYVEALKKNGSFSIDAQDEALRLAKDTVKRQINDDVRTYITANYGDFNTWLTSQIEATINTLKNK
ncbi:MAG: hypothetical protein PHX62_00795 [Bacilli bacterium]|nr:hypothetical protein [Bacilli bacterium]